MNEEFQLQPCEMVAEGFRDHHTYLNEDGDSVCWTCGRVRFAPPKKEMLSWAQIEAEEAAYRKAHGLHHRTSNWATAQSVLPSPPPPPKLAAPPKLKPAPQPRPTPKPQPEPAPKPPVKAAPVADGRVQMLTLAQAAAALGIPKNRLVQFVRTSLVRATLTDAGWLIHPTDLEAARDLGTPW